VNYDVTFPEQIKNEVYWQVFVLKVSINLIILSIIELVKLIIKQINVRFEVSISPWR